MSKEITVYKVKVDANWLSPEVTFSTKRHPHFVFQYPQLYRDDIGEDDEDWENDYFERMDEVVGKPVELYIVATDELGAFAQATAILNQHGDQD